jgi:hypothetical protein
VVQLAKHHNNLLLLFFTLLNSEKDLSNVIEALIILCTFSGFVHQREICTHKASCPW